MVRAPDPLGDAAVQPATDLAVLAAWAPELAETFVALSSDLALVVDDEGRIVQLAGRSGTPLGSPAWVGRAWVDTVSADSRAKVEQMLAELKRNGRTPRREVNHLADDGANVPMAYAAVRLGPAGPVLAVGHDLLAQALLQQRFVEAQLALERSYWASAGSAQARRDDDGEPGEEQLRAERDLLLALRRLVERVGHREGKLLLRDVRDLAERHFLSLALEREGRAAKAVKTPAARRRRRNRAS